MIAVDFPKTTMQQVRFPQFIFILVFFGFVLAPSSSLARSPNDLTALILKNSGARYGDFKTYHDLTKWLAATLPAAADQEFLKSYSSKLEQNERLPVLTISNVGQADTVNFKVISSGQVSTLKVVDILSGSYDIRGRSVLLGPTKDFKTQISNISSALGTDAIGHFRRLPEIFIPRAFADANLMGSVLSIYAFGLFSTSETDREKWAQVKDAADQARAACKNLGLSPFGIEFQGSEKSDAMNELKSAQGKICTHINHSPLALASPVNDSDRFACASTKMAENCMAQIRGKFFDPVEKATLLAKISVLDHLINSDYFKTEFANSGKRSAPPANATH